MLAALALVTSAMLLTDCGTTAHMAVRTTTTIAGKVPSRAEQAAALFATTSYRRQVVQAAEGFTTSVTELDGALRRGDRQAAIRAWAAAQGSFDLLRPVLLGGPASSATYDGQLLGGSKTRGKGLHAIERALFQGPLSDGLAAMPDLKAAGPQLVIGLFRTIIQPSGVAVNQVHALGFLADHVIANAQERVSHRDLIDVLAILHAVRGGLDALRPLANLVDPTQLAKTSRGLDQADALLSMVPASSTDAQVPGPVWARLGRLVAVLQFDFGQLAGSIAGYSSGRYYA